MLSKERKQICKHGHDTHIVGRSKWGACKECDRIRHKTFWRSSDKYKANNRNGKRDTRYSLNSGQYDALFLLQSGKCKICDIHQEKEARSLAVDHCHLTGKIRGLLCTKCNLILGLANDNPLIFKAAMDYLNQ